MLSAFRVHPRHVSAQKRARAFSAGVFEWEIFLRGAVENGLIQPDDALGPLAALQAAYRNFHQAFAEIEGLQRGLPALHSALARGDTRVLTDAFRSEIRAAHRTIDDRKRRSR